MEKRRINYDDKGREVIVAIWLKYRDRLLIRLLIFTGNTSVVWLARYHKLGKKSFTRDHDLVRYSWKFRKRR